MSNNETEFLPDIDDYLNKDQSSDINLKDLEELIYIVRSKTALSYEQCEVIIKEIFTNIRSEILQGNNIVIQDMGSIYITKSKTILYHTTKTIKDKLNGKI